MSARALSAKMRATATIVCLVIALSAASADRRFLQAGEGLHALVSVGHVQAMEGQVKAARSVVPTIRGIKGISEGMLNQLLGLAESQYQGNLKRRTKRMEDTTVDALGAGEFESVMLVPTYSCPIEARLGHWNENGKWVCLSQAGSGKREATALTFGTGCDTSFERDLFETMDIRSNMYDFDLTARTVDEFAALHFINYKNAGLTGSKKIDSKKRRFPKVNWVTLPSAMKEAGVTYADVVKVDCEGCEIDAVKDLAAHSNRTHPAAGQLLIEVHDVAEWKLPKIKDMMTTLEGLGFRLFHVEINPTYKMHYEVSLVHESLAKPRDLSQ